MKRYKSLALTLTRDKGKETAKTLKLYNLIRVSFLKRLVQQGYRDYVLTWEYYKTRHSREPIKVELISAGTTENWKFSETI